MNPIVRHSFRHVLAFGALASLIGVACSNKVNQCNDLILKANATQISQPGADGKGDGKDDDKAMGAMADQLDKSKADILSVSLTDTTLKGYQTDYANTLVQMSTAARALQTGGDKQDQVGMQSAMKDLQTAWEANGKVVDNINKYCSGT